MAGHVHDFVIVIPVADRPEHLGDCLASLAELLRQYPYAGEVRVLVVDDSLDEANQARLADLANRFVRDGLNVEYLGQAEQRRLVESLPGDLRARLAGVLGDGASYARKGASITRNIAYLWLQRLPRDDARRLFWFLDSDQEFRVNIEIGDGGEATRAIDYLGGLDRMFRETPTRILTGKVVGDPPVSPAVMAGHFIDDVIAFLAEAASLDPHAACGFHGAARQADDAAYHDMADLFGFRVDEPAYRYRCVLTGPHDHAACMADFAARLGRFFDGEHPTRRSHYIADDLMASIKPARTVYTGNYVVAAEALEWFIPFASLKLRMAGPTLGRIVKAEIGGAFVSANLPMLHKRTQGESGRSECRPGVVRDDAVVDLSGEIERQYFGDVMLFSVDLLTREGYPDRALPAERIGAVVQSVELEMRARYRAQQASTTDRICALTRAIEAIERSRWPKAVGGTGALVDLRRFRDNLRDNFAVGARGMHKLDDDSYRQGRLAAIVAAIDGHPADRAAWRAALELDRS